MSELKLVKWVDAFGCPAGWQHEEEVEKGVSVVQSVGFVIDETEQTLTLAPHIGGLNRDNRQMAGVITLPKQQIISAFSYPLPELAPMRLENMTESQIIAHFEKYGFRDELGHELILCRDFLDLVALAAKKP